MKIKTKIRIALQLLLLWGIVCWLILITSCHGVRPVTDEKAPRCCKMLFLTLYLIQESKAVNLQSLLDCCRIEEKIEFCKEQKGQEEECLTLMKTF